MSSEALKWWRRARRRAPYATAALVLGEIAYEHRDGVSWQPQNVARWAREIGVARRTAGDAIEALEAAGLIERHGRKVKLRMDLTLVESGGPPPVRVAVHRRKSGGPPPESGGTPPPYKGEVKEASRPHGAATPPLPKDAGGDIGGAEDGRAASPVNGAARPSSGDIADKVAELRAIAARQS